MKKSRKSHNQKTIADRQRYHKYIESQNNVPTVDYGHDFPSTSKAGEDLSEPTASKQRRQSLSAVLKNHFVEHWPTWLVAIFIALLSYFAIDAKMNLAELGFGSKAHEQAIRDGISERKDLSAKNNEQDLKIQENKMHIEFINKTLDKTPISSSSQTLKQ